MAGDTREINLKVKVGAEGVQNITMTERSLDKLDRSARKADTGMNKAGRATTVMSRGLSALPPQIKLIIATITALIAIVGALAVSGVKAFAAFESQVGVVSTMLDENALGLEKYQEYLDRYGEGLRQLSTDMGEDTRTLSKGLYDILSASVAPEKAMSVLETSAKAAKAGITDTATSVDFITSALNAYGMEADKAGQVSDIAFATVASGKLTFQELASTIGEVAPTANMAGVSLEALGAMMATTTKSGIKAAESSTAINQFMLAFIKAGPKAATTWGELARGTELQGQAWGAALLKGGNLAKTLGVLKGANESQLTTIFNNVRALKAANVLAKQADDYRANLARTTNSLGETERAYNKVSGDLSDQWSKVKKIATDLVTTIGQGLAPAIKSVTGGVIDWYKSNGKLLKADILIWVNRLTGSLGRVKSLLTLGGSSSNSTTTTYSDLEKTQEELAKAKSALSWAKINQESSQKTLDEGHWLYSLGAETNLSRHTSDVKTFSTEVELLNQKLDLLYGKLGKVKDLWQLKAEGQEAWFQHQQNAWMNSREVTGATDSWKIKNQLFAQTTAADKAALAEIAKIRDTEYQKDLALMNARLAKMRAGQTSEILIAQARSIELAKINAKQAEREEEDRKKELSAWQTQNKSLIDLGNQRHKAWELLHGNIREGLKAATENERKLDEKALADKKTYLSLVADLSGDTNAQRLVQYQEFVEQVDKLQIAQYEKEELLALKRADLQKSTFERVLDSWTDTTANMQTLTEESLKGIKGIFQSFFDDLFDDFKISWSSLLDVVKGTASNLLSQTATSWTTTAFAAGAKWVMNQFSGTAQAAATGSPNSGFSFTSLLSGGGSWWAAPDLTYQVSGTPIGAMTAEQLASQAGFFGQGGWMGTGLSGAGAAASGFGGALTGWQTAQMLYGNGTGAQIGGGVGGAAGGIAGAAVGQILIPVPGVGAGIGALVGGMLGGAGGGGIGSLFDGSDDTAEREADMRAYTAAMTTLLDSAYLRRVQSGQESFDAAAYLQAQQRAHESDNRVGWETLEDDYAKLKASGVLPWWMPDVSRANALRGTDAYTDEDMLKRDTLAGLLGQAFTGNSALGWGLEDPFASFSTETVDTLGESLTTIQTGAEAFGVTLTDLFENISAADMASGEWANILANELSPAQLMSRMEDKLRAEGLSNLEIAQQKVSAIIDTLLGTFDMSEENQAAWVEQLLNATSTQADLAAKTEEYAGIVQQLQSAHELDDASINDLITRGRDLRKELGLGESAFSGVETAMKSMQKALTDDVTPALVDLVQQLKAALAEAEGGDTEKNHTGGLIRNHSGGIIQAALAAGLISASGGRMHSGGGASSLAADEVMRILQLGEFVIRRDSVTPLTRPFLEDLNNRGEAALASYVPLISPEEGPARASASGGGIVINIGSIVVPNESGDEADARAYGEAFAEEFVDRVMVRLKDASGAGQGVVHEAGIISRRFGHAS